MQTFWEDNGFTLRTNQPKLGIMETDWAENRANLPQTGLRKLIGKALDSVYDTGLRDMYRTRVEKVNGGVEIYISHRGMEEVYTSASKDSTTWQPRAADPELETELLRRLMIALGTDEASAKAALQNSTNTLKGASIQGEQLIVNDTMENTWRRVGQVLDRAGLSVTDRDISQRIYYVTPNPDDRGMFKKSFGKLNETYQVRFSAVSANQVKVSFADKSGKIYTDEGLSKVLKNLQDNLK
jgi:outer membrane protein assembly factor BamC